MTTPQQRQRTADLAARAFSEARAMAGAAPASARTASGELAAAALRAHGVLSAARTQPVPVTALGPNGREARGLAVFLAVYAAQHAPHVARDQPFQRTHQPRTRRPAGQGEAA
ncbi:hypothetical protein ACFVDU_29810 [Streptomyces albidoflavus]